PASCRPASCSSWSYKKKAGATSARDRRSGFRGESRATGRPITPPPLIGAPDQPIDDSVILLECRLHVPEISIHLDVGLANDAAERLVLLANVSSEILAANPDWIKPKRSELVLGFGHLQGRGEPIHEPRNRCFRRMCRRDDSLPEVDLDVV